MRNKRSLALKNSKSSPKLRNDKSRYASRKSNNRHRTLFKIPDLYARNRTIRALDELAAVPGKCSDCSMFEEEIFRQMQTTSFDGGEFLYTRRRLGLHYERHEGWSEFVGHHIEDNMSKSPNAMNVDAPVDDSVIDEFFDLDSYEKQTIATQPDSNEAGAAPAAPKLREAAKDLMTREKPRFGA